MKNHTIHKCTHTFNEGYDRTDYMPKVRMILAYSPVDILSLLFTRVDEATHQSSRIHFIAHSLYTCG